MTRARTPIGLFLALVVVWMCWLVERPMSASVPANTQFSFIDVATAIRADVDDATARQFTTEERAMLTALYRPREFRALWIDAQLHETGDAREAIALLARANEDGLDPLSYRVDQLRAQTVRLATSGSVTPRDLAVFDVLLSQSTLRYLHDLRVGRIDPRTVGVALLSSDTPDFAAILRAALMAHRISETVAEQRPPLTQYAAMRAELERYRSRLTDATLEPLPFAGVLKPGDRHPGLRILHRWLVAFGDMPGDDRSSADDIFEGTLVEGVKRFQTRHGLEPDGVLGRHTQAALRVPLAWRVRQIELALERLRWWPRQRSERLVMINIPMFRLWAWDVGAPNDPPSLRTAVIVGRATRTETPTIVEHVREVIFRPYWNVPPSILRHEILPALSRHPDYLIEQDMEIVRGEGDDAPSVEVTDENLNLLRQGALRLRQRPGPRNALGLVKFAFPNIDNVYLHGTPARSLFLRPRRDFSHGCVRVEDAIGLAEWALSDRPEWTRDRIIEAMNGTASLHVKVERPIQVVLFYTTAAVLPDDGMIHFAEDIYDQDKRLDQALARHSEQHR